MASAVDICNLALSHLGDAATVASIAPPEQSVQAEACAKFYPIARDQLLEMHAWRFAVRRVALPELSTNPVDSWRFAYELPSAVVRPLAVLMPESTDDTDTQDYAVESLDDGTQVVYTNVEAATLRYIARITDSTRFTPGFVTALSWLLASYLAGPVLKGKVGAAAKEACERRFAVEASKAMSLSANSSRTSTYRDHKPSWITGR